MTREPITRADQVTDEILDMAEDTFSGWFDNDEPIDWEWEKYGFWSRMESDHGIDLGDQNDTPAMRKIQKHVRAYRRQG